MATPNVGILTTAGKALIDKVNSGQAKISFSKIVFSSMDNSQLSDTQVKALTAIAPQEVVVSSPETTLDTNSGETRIRATGTNEKLADGVYVKTYGVFAKDDTGSEILYGVTVSPNPNYFPAYDGVTPQAVTYSYKTVIQETSNITMTNSNDVYASQEDLTEALQPYAKTVDVNQQLDKKVNIADMRKPASDVAGIEEVNAKQDKIGYTPADDSKVVHSTDMRKPASDVVGLEDVSNGLYKGSLAINTDLDTLTQEGIYDFYGAPFVNFIDSDNHWGTIQIINKGAVVIQCVICTGSIGDQIFFRTKSGYPATWGSWTMAPRFEMDGHVTLPDGESIKPADDSKVSHLSGANNFDTVPTVNNNPLLLASSLPSDLARTGSNQEFTGKNTFDTAPIDKTTGNPYITKDGVPAVPSTLADTTKPANFTAGLQSGGVDVATAADLKSLVDSTWLPIKVSADWQTTPILMKYDSSTGNTDLIGAFSKKWSTAQGIWKGTILTLPIGFEWTSGDNKIFDSSGGSTISLEPNKDNPRDLMAQIIWGYSSPASGYIHVDFTKSGDYSGIEKEKFTTSSIRKID